MTSVSDGRRGYDRSEQPDHESARSGTPDRADSRIEELVRRLSSGEDLDRRTRGRLLARLARAMGSSARRAGVAGVARGQWLADLLMRIAPHLGVRDLETLSEHYGGLRGEELADALVRTATRTTTGVGVAGGGLATVEYGVPSALLYTPAQIAGETLAVAAVEVKLIAELHEVHGVEVPGNGRQRAAAFLQSWARRRGIDPRSPSSLPRALGPAARNALQRRLAIRLSRNVTTLGPLFTGAVAGGLLNREATRELAASVREDLRG